METGMAGIACPKVPISGDNPGKSMTRRDRRSRLLAAFPGQLTTILRLELDFADPSLHDIALVFGATTETWNRKVRASTATMG